MKILIICDMFPPAFGPRMGYLCKYMKRAGWEPVVITEFIQDQTFSFLTEKTQVTYVNFYRAKGKLSRKLEWLLVFLLDFFFHYKDRRMYKTASSFLQESGFGGILCSTYRTFPLPAAAKAARDYRLPFVADLRDVVEQYAAHEYISHSFHTFPWLDNRIRALFRRQLLQNRNKALRQADRVTTVSPWHVDLLSRYNPQVELIYNGYDPELFYPESHKTSRFLITYTGRLISLATRDPRLLWEAVARLDKEKQITPDIFRVQWYVDEESKNILSREADRYGVSGYMDYYPYIPASEVPGVLNRSSVLLQLANKSDGSGPKGFMTTKLFEALAVEKPVLCVRSDESYLEETIRKTRCGLAARTAEEAYEFIRQHYRCWQEKGETASRPHRAEIESFSRKKQAEQFMDIFTTLNRKNESLS